MAVNLRMYESRHDTLLHVPPKRSIVFLLVGCEANPHAKRLYDDLLHDYNRLIRPVPNFTETLTVRLGLKLSQLIDVDLKNQVMTTNVWVDQVSK